LKPLAQPLIRSLSVAGQFVIYGGFSSEKFELHNFDILMRGSAIKSYIYRYFFTPPQREDAKLLREIAEISGQSKLRVPVGGLHPLEDFKTAIYETAKHSERGKRFFTPE
jgi:NADPH:quinone reductase